ncbi:type B DNA-directed DNA polymerase [Halobaculum sp. MBLA0147]|uniref:type B DNA-directed DNA polymerase n=1 Tax=Halobaculum sp. MBLA0147 TaxID=3079934 RepID=UPI003523EFC9
MPYAIDVLDGDPVAWSLTGTPTDPGWAATVHESYRPALFVVTRHGMTAADPDPERCRTALADLRETLADHPAVVDQRVETRRPGYRFAEQPTLRVAVDRMRRVRRVATFVEDRGPPGRVPYRAFDVDLSPGFRFCLDRDRSPVPDRLPTVYELRLPSGAMADEDLSRLRLGTTTTTGPDAVAEAPDTLTTPAETARAALETLAARLDTLDPDVLVVNRAAVVPLVADSAERLGVDLGLPRVPTGLDREVVPTYRQLAERSTFESYGQRHHSPARYDVPGRVLLDRSNTFFLDETNLAGCLDLVARSRKPLQELGWASIGNVLTAIQIREARARDVLVQWHAWRPERFKTARQLHAGDRGGTTLAPAVGLHETVHELDFASLYPNVICRHNLSPETVRCRCHDRADVPELGYSVCDRDGVLPDVLEPIVDDRAAAKRRLREDDLSATERDRLAGRSRALKWILVSCFGYQGFSNAKFGRIEVHEAINAYARDILLTAKETLEAAGWRVLHGIVDSLWVTPREGATQEPLDAVAARVSADVGVDLEYESAFDWVAFCTRRDGDAGALTRYVGRRADPGPDEDRYKTRGIEARQRSTPSWVADVQRDLIETLDETRDADAVVGCLAEHLRSLAAGDVSARALLVRQRVTKTADAYDHRTRAVAALRRAERLGRSVHPGQDVQYLVVDDDAATSDRVRLRPEVEPGTRYDAAFYRRLALRATASVLSPLGWDLGDVETAVATGRNDSLVRF